MAQWVVVKQTGPEPVKRRGQFDAETVRAVAAGEPVKRQVSVAKRREELQRQVEAEVARKLDSLTPTEWAQAKRAFMKRRQLEAEARSVTRLNDAVLREHVDPVSDGTLVGGIETSRLEKSDARKRGLFRFVLDQSASTPTNFKL